MGTSPGMTKGGVHIGRTPARLTTADPATPRCWSYAIHGIGFGCDRVSRNRRAGKTVHLAWPRRLHGHHVLPRAARHHADRVAGPDRGAGERSARLPAAADRDAQRS